MQYIYIHAGKTYIHINTHTIKNVKSKLFLKLNLKAGTMAFSNEEIETVCKSKSKASVAYTKTLSPKTNKQKQSRK